MIKRQFICRDCGYKFVVTVLEPGEAKEKRITGAPIHCEKCGSASVERA